MTDSGTNEPCTRCGEAFADLVGLLYHRCPGRTDARRGPQTRDRRRGQGSRHVQRSARLLGRKGATQNRI